MKILKISFLFIFLFVGFQNLQAQVEENLKYVKIETSDGNEFIGTISSEDAEKLVLKTDKLGEISISKSDIKSQKTIKVSQIKDGKLWFDNPQATRYFWAPNGYGLKKGEYNYQNIDVLWNQLSYGITDNISIGGGVIPLFFFGGAPTPIFITPKFSIPIIKDKFNVGGGALIGAILGDGDDVGGLGIVYALSTFGNRDSNISVSLGYGYVDGEWAESPLVNISGLHRVSSRFYLLSENYYIKIDDEALAIISFGGRWMIKKAALDFILAAPIASGMDEIIVIPSIGFTIPFGNY